MPGSRFKGVVKLAVHVKIARGLLVGHCLALSNFGAPSTAENRQFRTANVWDGSYCSGAAPLGRRQLYVPWCGDTECNDASPAADQDPSELGCKEIVFVCVSSLPQGAQSKAKAATAPGCVSPPGDDVMPVMAVAARYSRLKP
jgi:hypothetical protein